MKLLKIIGLSFLGMVSIGTYAQELDANLQLRPRYEYRNGFKSLMPNGEMATSFVSQRSRLNFNYKQEKLKVKLTFQNIRTWGDVATTTQVDKNGIAFKTIDFSENERLLYENSLSALKKYKRAFEGEGNEDLYQQKLKEDMLGRELYNKSRASRYLYIIA